MTVVRIEKLRKSYGDFLALSDISLDIPSGSFFTLLGPSGCGKTTLLRTLAGFHKADSGRIVVAGAAIENVPAHKRDMGMVFQDYAIFPHLSVADNVAFGLHQRKVPKAELVSRVEEVLKITQLTMLAARMPHELSGGQQQRVGIARALVIRPKVLLMDEPLSNLDAKLRVELRHELRVIQQKMGITTVYVTHDQEEALSMSDIICVMYGGVIQQASAPFTLYKEPANKFVATFVGENNFLSPQALSATENTASFEALKLSGRVPTGTKAVVAIRPEDVTLELGNEATSTRVNGASAIRLTARIESLSFLGRDLRVSATLPNGEAIFAVAHPTPERIALKQGDKAMFVFAPTAAQVFEDSMTGRRL
jgi:iron(III) transport system ATP-binding protein